MASTSESLLTATGVKLYGRVIAGLGIDLADARAELGGNRFLREQLEADDARLARIYGFSFNGRYVPLSRPAIFLVHGEGQSAPTAATHGSHDAWSSLDVAAEAYACCSFAGDLRVWEYDRGDFSLRLDVDSGPLQRILIDAETVDTDEMPYFRGARTRLQNP